MTANAIATGADPLVSVIIPVYQGERLILGAVHSVLLQTHRHLEVWVVDDGSTDDTVNKLSEIDDMRLHILQQPNGGTASARNAALRLARGSYIAFLDADDRWLPDKVAIELETLRNASNPIAIAYSAHYAVGDQGELLRMAPNRSEKGNVFELLLDGEDFLMPSLCLFDRRIFDKIGLFEKRYHEDYDFVLRATREFPIFPTGRHLAVYRQTTSGKCRKILENYDSALSAEEAVVEGLAGVLDRDQSRRLRANVIRSLYLRFLMYGFNDHARRLLPNVDRNGLNRDVKGKFGILFAQTGVNLLAPARLIVHALYRATKQNWWRRQLAETKLELRYE